MLDSTELDGGERLARPSQWVQALRGIANHNEWTPGFFFIDALPFENAEFQQGERVIIVPWIGM